MLLIWAILSLSCLVKSLSCTNQALVFICLQYKSLENTVGKGEICLHQTISPFITVVSEDIYQVLEICSMRSLSKEKPTLSREINQNAFFFFRIMLPFSTWTFYRLSTCMLCSCSLSPC